MNEYLTRLLFEQECVVLPGFGGFITQYKPAELDFATKRLQPPVKKIAFNRSLNTNDGLLISLIAKDEHISYKQAEMKINDFVMQCEKNLQINGSMLFEGIGKVFIDESKSLQFNPSASFTSFTSYGLGDISITPVNRIKEMLIESIGDKPVETYEDEIVALRKKRKFSIWPFRISAILAATFVISSLLINLRTDSSHYENASLFPTYHVTKTSEKQSPKIEPNNRISETTQLEKVEIAVPVLPTPVIPSPLKKTPEKNIAVVPEKKPTSENTASLQSLTIDKVAVSLSKPNENVIKNDDIAVSEPTQPKKQEVKTMSTVVVGSFSNKSNAENYQMQLLSTGYKPYVAGANDNYRVCIAVSDAELENKLAKIRSDINTNAWVIEKK